MKYKTEPRMVPRETTEGEGKNGYAMVTQREKLVSWVVLRSPMRNSPRQTVPSWGKDDERPSQTIIEGSQ